MTADVEIANLDQLRSAYNGRVVRLAMLMTHYRAPLNWTEARMKEANKVFGRWVRVATPNEDKPPEDVIEALEDDLNTPLAISRVTRYAKAGEGDKVYSSMKLLGFL